MKQFHPDVGHLGYYYYVLTSAKEAERRINLLAELIQYYDKYINLYPQVKVEHLEPIYRLARGLGAFNRDFLSIQLSGGWRGLVAGGLYAILKPSDDLVPLLESIDTPYYPENLWSSKCALASIKSLPWPNECKHLEAPLSIIRKCIDRLNIKNTPIRRDLNSQELQNFKQFKNFTRQTYRKFGAAQTKWIIKNRPEYQWVVSYDEWMVMFASEDDCISIYR